MKRPHLALLDDELRIIEVRGIAIRAVEGINEA